MDDMIIIVSINVTLSEDFVTKLNLDCPLIVMHNIELFQIVAAQR